MLNPVAYNILGNAATVTGFVVAAGKSLTVNNTLIVSGVDGSTLNIGAGGTLGSAAFTAATAYDAAGAAAAALASAIAADASLAPKASPVLTGTPTAPTAAAATNTTQIATTQFVQQELATAVAGLLDFKGNVDASGNPNYPAASKGDTYYVNVAGKIGGASGKSVDIGDAVIANADNAGGTEASVGASWFVLEHNLAGALLAANNLSDVASVPTARTSLGLGTGDSPTFAGVTASTFNGSATSVLGFNRNGGTLTLAASGKNVTFTVASSTNRTYTMPDADSTIVAAGAATGSGLTMATARLLGRTTASSGAIEEITVGSGLSLSAGILTATGGGGTGANPTASVGLTAVNGSASTFLRSDGAPALDVTIAPTWTGAHVFTNANPIALGVNATTLGKIKLFGNTSGDVTVQPMPAAGTATLIYPTTSGMFALAGAVCNGRITTETGVSVSTSDRTSQGVLYWTVHGGGQVALYNGSTWETFTLAGDIGLSLTLTSGKNYDICLVTTGLIPTSTNTSTDIITTPSQSVKTGALVQVATTGGGLTAGTNYWWNAASSTTGSMHATLADALAGTNKVDLTASITSSLRIIHLEKTSWTNDTTRNIPLVTQDGILTLSGSPTFRYVGTIRASGTDITEDSVAKRFVWNLYNQVDRPLFITDTTANWTYTTDNWRQVRATAANKVEVVVGLSGRSLVSLSALSVARNSSVGPAVYCGIGEDSTSAIPTNALIGTIDNPVVGGNNDITANYRTRPTLGYHYFAWLERSQASGTSTWFGASSGNFTPGIHGTVEC